MLRESLTSAGVGAGLMYFLDPHSGHRRRAQVRDRATRARRRLLRAVGRTGRDLWHRGRGLAARARATMTPESPSDQVVLGRVRARLGRYVAHARSIHVEVRQGAVQLTGPILAREADALVASIGKIGGVRTVVDRLERHESGLPRSLADDSPAWRPPTRLVAELGGGLVGLYAARRGRWSLALAGGGAVLLARVRRTGPAHVRPLRAPARRAFEPSKTITVQAPLHEVFLRLKAIFDQGKPRRYDRTTAKLGDLN